jgi:hypothetical protein
MSGAIRHLELVHSRHTHAPNEKNRVLYQKRFAAFTQFYRQMKSVYKRMNS